MMKRAKIEILVLLTVVCGLVFNAIYSSLVQAGAEADRDENMMVMRTLALAASNCLKSGGAELIKADFGENGLLLEKRNEIRNFLSLSDEEVMFDDGKAIYSTILGEYNIDEYDGGFNKNHGIVMCNKMIMEHNVSFIGKILELSGKNSQEYKNQLFCNGSDPGLVNILL